MDGLGVTGVSGVRIPVGFQSEIRRGSDGSGRISALPGNVRGAGSLYSAEQNEIWPVDPVLYTPPPSPSGLCSDTGLS